MNKYKWSLFAHYRVRVNLRQIVNGISVSDLTLLTLQNKSIIVSPYRKHDRFDPVYPGEYILMPVHQKTIELFELADISHICSRDVIMLERIQYGKKLITR